MLTRTSTALLCATIMATGSTAIAQVPAAAPAATPTSATSATAQAPDAESKRKVVKRVMPSYPPIARAGRLSGKVKLELVVGLDGKVQTVKILGGNPLFEEAATDAAKLMRFEAGSKETTEVIAFEFVPGS